MAPLATYLQHRPQQLGAQQLVPQHPRDVGRIRSGCSDWWWAWACDGATNDAMAPVDVDGCAGLPYGWPRSSPTMGSAGMSTAMYLVRLACGAGERGAAAEQWADASWLEEPAALDAARGSQWTCWEARRWCHAEKAMTRMGGIHRKPHLYKRGSNNHPCIMC